MNTCTKSDNQDSPTQARDEKMPYIIAYIDGSVLRVNYEDLIKYPELMIDDRDRVFKLKALAEEQCAGIGKFCPMFDTAHLSSKEQQQRFLNEKMKKKAGWGRR